MMGERRVMQEALFYGFSLERHVPDSHLLRKIDRFVDLSEVRAHLEPYYSETGRPSIDPELMIRMLIVGYCFGIRSERRLCEEAHLNLAYRWFCRLGLDGDVPDHSTFSKNRHGRFRESDLLRKLFETVVARCMKEGIVGGEAFAVDASIIVADAHRRRSVAKIEDLDPTSNRAVAEYLSVLDDAAFGGATPVEPKVISPTDPAARYTASANSVAGYAYSDNYLIDLKHAVIMDVEATTTIRQAEVGAAKTMLDRTAEQFDVTPSRLVADAGYGSAEMVGWLVDERGIEPHVKLMDKAERTDGTLSRSDFAFDPERNLYVCPGGKELKKHHRAFAKPRDGLTKDDEGRDDDLLCAQAGLRGLRAQAQVLPERSCAQNRALCSRSRARQGPCDRQDRGLRRLTSRTKEGRDALRASEAHRQARSIAPPRPKWSQRRVPTSTSSQRF